MTAIPVSHMETVRLRCTHSLSPVTAENAAGNGHDEGQRISLLPPMKVFMGPCTR
jgi:hypothetical protein